MVTDEILGALNMINQQLSTPEAKQAGKVSFLRKMEEKIKEEVDRL